MSQQESVFFDNEQESVYEPRQNNAAAVTNQQAKQDGTYGFLTPEQSLLQGEKLLPKSRSFQGSNDAWKWKVVLAIICFLLIAIGLTISAIPQQLTGPGSIPMPVQNGAVPHQQVFNVGPHPKIVLNSINSNVQVTVGDNNTVTVSGMNPNHKNYGSHDWSGDIQARPNHNEIIITRPSTREDFRDDSEQSMNIIVPEQADIEVHNITGDINIAGVSGLIQARTQKGDITLSRVVLNSTSLLQTLNGNIRFNAHWTSLGYISWQQQMGAWIFPFPPTHLFAYK